MLVWALWRSFGLEGGYPFVQLVAYTPYVLGLSLLSLLVLALLRQWLPLVVATVAVAALALAVLPRALGGPDEVNGGGVVRVLSFNMRRGRANVTELLDVLDARKIDVLSLQEVSTHTLERLKRRGLDERLPYRIAGTGGKGGAAIYSRFRLTRVKSTLTRFRQPRAWVYPPGSITFGFMAVHPRAPIGPEKTALWNHEFPRLPGADDPGPPRVLAGDFNATLDHAKMRDLINTGYRDAGDVMGRGLVSTWPSRRKWPLPVTLDHVLVEDPIAIIDYDVVGIKGSDHRAVYTKLVVPDR